MTTEEQIVARHMLAGYSPDEFPDAPINLLPILRKWDRRGWLEYDCPGAILWSWLSEDADRLLRAALGE